MFLRITNANPMPDEERPVQTAKQGSSRDNFTLARTLAGAFRLNRVAQIGERLRKL